MDTALEQILITTSKDRHGELITLLARHLSQWCFDDPVYRFGHQNFKVFALAGQTEEIVRSPRSLPLSVAVAVGKAPPSARPSRPPTAATIGLTWRTAPR